MNAAAAIQAYRTLGLESEVRGASPHHLVSLLLQGAIQAIAAAKAGIQAKDIPAKGAAISKAIAIIGEGLNASLDKKTGGDLAQNLAALYDYMIFRLVSANLKNDLAVLDEVSLLLAGIKDAWDQIAPGQA